MSFVKFTLCLLLLCTTFAFDFKNAINKAEDKAKDTLQNKVDDKLKDTIKNKVEDKLKDTVKDKIGLNKVPVLVKDPKEVFKNFKTKDTKEVADKSKDKIIKNSKKISDLIKKPKEGLNKVKDFFNNDIKKVSDDKKKGIEKVKDILKKPSDIFDKLKNAFHKDSKNISDKTKKDTEKAKKVIDFFKDPKKFFEGEEKKLKTKFMNKIHFNSSKNEFVNKIEKIRSFINDPKSVIKKFGEKEATELEEKLKAELKKKLEEKIRNKFHIFGKDSKDEDGEEHKGFIENHTKFFFLLVILVVIVSVCVCVCVKCHKTKDHHFLENHHIFKRRNQKDQKNIEGTDTNTLVLN